MDTIVTQFYQESNHKFDGKHSKVIKIAIHQRDIKFEWLGVGLARQCGRSLDLASSQEIPRKCSLSRQTGHYASNVTPSRNGIGE